MTTMTSRQRQTCTAKTNIDKAAIKTYKGGNRYDLSMREEQTEAHQGCQENATEGDKALEPGRKDS